MNGSALECRGLCAGYHAGAPVVRDLDLHVNEGEVVALLGANGAGKTTTLLTLSGLLRSLGGTASVLGLAVAPAFGRRLVRRGLGHVPEDRSLFFELTVRENLLLGCRRRATDRIASQLEIFPELTPLLDRRAGLLSGGEQQMLALARALVGSPRVLMVDEMSLGLAPVIVQRLLPVLREFAQETQAAILLVEQHVALALEVADRAYVLMNGRVTLDGDASDLANRRDLLEHSYLGSAV